MCSATVPNVQTLYSAASYPTAVINPANSLGRKNLDTEAGKYEYAARSPDKNAPIRGNTFRKYQRYKSPKIPGGGSVNSRIATVPPGATHEKSPATHPHNSPGCETQNAAVTRSNAPSANGSRNASASNTGMASADAAETLFARRAHQHRMRKIRTNNLRPRPRRPSQRKCQIAGAAAQIEHARIRHAAKSAAHAAQRAAATRDPTASTANDSAGRTVARPAKTCRVP